ncbi:hypothetical protein F5984_13775 [Rudanella paleaurantiibacter]|uniref:Uncharacterized protein n=1 Tax=Rudanella paleaurantiibacter TaxID=2614655 RepID=A0A7J5TZ53_9BACT|nr:hypothetical protein [Rudanella paleaurantiibacter]KAB7730237.1 hypothetical protein F5984_13775 [Rudanella paleaurantiibacter]
MTTKRFILVLLGLVLLDAFTRGMGPALTIYLSSGKWDLRLAGAIATMFLLYRSWLYILGSGLFLLLVERLPLRKPWYVMVGFLYGLVGYLLYYYFWSFPEFEHRHFRFATRIIQYPLFGIWCAIGLRLLSTQTKNVR